MQKKGERMVFLSLVHHPLDPFHYFVHAAGHLSGSFSTGTVHVPGKLNSANSNDAACQLQPGQGAKALASLSQAVAASSEHPNSRPCHGQNMDKSVGSRGGSTGSRGGSAGSSGGSASSSSGSSAESTFRASLSFEFERAIDPVLSAEASQTSCGSTSERASHVEGSPTGTGSMRSVNMRHPQAAHQQTASLSTAPSSSQKGSPAGSSSGDDASVGDSKEWRRWSSSIMPGHTAASPRVIPPPPMRLRSLGSSKPRSPTKDSAPSRLARSSSAAAESSSL